MKIELKIYLTRRQRMMLKRLRLIFLNICYSLKAYILPFIEIVAGLIMVMSICCMDSPNFKLVFGSYCVSALVLGACHLFSNYIDAELRRIRRSRYV